MSAVRYVPERGDIVETNFDPAAGSEQAHRRPALVLSISAFNLTAGLALVVPITSVIRGNPFEVPMGGTATKGVALCHQVKMIDYEVRGIVLIEKAPARVLRDALNIVRTFVQ